MRVPPPRCAASVMPTAAAAAATRMTNDRRMVSFLSQATPGRGRRCEVRYSVSEARGANPGIRARPALLEVLVDGRVAPALGLDRELQPHQRPPVVRVLLQVLA